MSTVTKWIPYTLPWDDAPVDLSWIYASEKPAGKHGFLLASPDRFVFEDGTEGRFWGTNFNSAANFPSHAHSEKVAQRLAKIGVNMVRFHQLDAEWSTPNIFQFTKGRRPDNTQSLDPQSMDRLDYLVYCLKREGVYVYLDLLTYRKFKSGDGIAEADKLVQEARPYSNFDRRLIELQKRFNHDLWTHYNPYTQCAYKDDPVFVLTEITNENDLFFGGGTVDLEPYRGDLENRYRAWALTHSVSLKPEPVVFDRQDANIVAFLMEVQKAYYREMIDHLRDIGVRIPIAGTNWTISAAHLACQTVADFTDSHAYWYDWSWKSQDKRFMNAAMVASHNTILPPLVFNRVLDKPHFVSEWDNPWPNEYRADTSLYLAAVGSMQGWGGFCIHTYRYDADETTDLLGKPITSDAIGGVCYRGGVFDTFNDPAKFGLFYHAALITRRQDVSPAKQAVAVRLDDPREPMGKAYVGLAEKHKVVSVLPGEKPGSTTVVANRDAVVPEEAGEVSSDNGQLYRSWKKRVGWINTPRTKAVYGFVGGQGEIRLGAAGVTAETDFATIAISSLTDAPIEVSDNMLLTAVGRADNTDARYNEDHTVQLNLGHGPILVEAIRAGIAIKTDRKNLCVWAVNPRGIYIGKMPAEYRDGEFRFSIGGEFASMYYLIQAE